MNMYAKHVQNMCTRVQMYGCIRARRRCPVMHGACTHEPNARFGNARAFVGNARAFRELHVHYKLNQKA